MSKRSAKKVPKPKGLRPVKSPVKVRRKRRTFVQLRCVNCGELFRGADGTERCTRCARHAVDPRQLGLFS